MWYALIAGMGMWELIVVCGGGCLIGLGVVRGKRKNGK